MNEETIAALATQRALGHLGEGAPSEGEPLTPNERLIRAIFGVEKTPEEILATRAAAKAAERAVWDEKAAAAAARQAEAAAARQAAAAAERAAEDGPAIARVAMVNAAIDTLVAEGVLADHDYAQQPRVWGLRWAAAKREVLAENSHQKSPEAWALYKALREEGVTCPDRAADLLAEICGLLDEPQ